MTGSQVGGAPSAFLDVRDLRVSFPTPDGVVRAVDGVSFTLERGQTLGIVGESGSGKSVTSLAVMGLLSRADAQVSGGVWFLGEELLGAGPRRVLSLRGSSMTMIYQDPLSALHPYYTVGWQIAEAYRAKNPVSRKQAWDRAVEMLRRVEIPQPERRARDYPHQFSGGMRQRAMIAMALSCDPGLLIADEPTTALDVTVQAQILDLIKELQAESGTAVIVITHDLGVVAEVAEKVMVMYAGRVVERGATEQVFTAPQHPYTWGLLKSVTRLDRDRRERLEPISGTPPSLIDVPSGCPFHPRCRYAGMTAGLSVTDRPDLRDAGQDHWVACHLDDDARSRIFLAEVAPSL
jgi:peptide/nickel transport system ATP-binding protein